jgi:hypothetical protein
MPWFNSKKINYENSLNKMNEQLINLRHDLRDVSNHLKIVELELKESIEFYYTQLEYLSGVYSLLPNLGALPPTRGWATSPDFLLKLTEVVLSEKPQFILELGSGVSTLVLNASIEKNETGKIVSIDHDERFVKLSESYLRSNDLREKATIEFCPLKKYNIDNEEWFWYNIDSIKFEQKIDILVVDGPPRIVQKNSRYPAVPLLHTYFAKSSRIILDDYKREDEQEIVRLWVRDLTSLSYNVDVIEFLSYEKGMAILEITASD